MATTEAMSLDNTTLRMQAGIRSSRGDCLYASVAPSVRRTATMARLQH